MATYYCRQPGGYYNNATVASPDGSEANPFNYTWPQISTLLVAGHTVRLHPSYLLTAAYIETGTMICSNGILERWDLAGWDWIMPSFWGLVDVPSGAWVNAGSGNWYADFNGSLGMPNRTYSAGMELQGWWGHFKGQNDIRPGYAYAGTGRRLATVGELASVGEYAIADNGAGKVRLTVKTGGVNPTALWGAYVVNGSQVMILNEVKNLTIRFMAYWGGSVYHWPAGNRICSNLTYEDCYLMLSTEPGFRGAPYTCGSASGATTNSAGYAIGATVITLAAAGTGTVAGTANYTDAVSFSGDTNIYRIASGGGNANVAAGGTITLAAPGLLQAIPASATAISVRKVPELNDITFKRCTAIAGWPTVGRVFNATLPQENGSADAWQFYGLGKRITVIDPRTLAWSHSAFSFIAQDATTSSGFGPEVGLDGLQTCAIIPQSFDDPGDGWGAYNIIDCGLVDYMRGLLMLCRDWYVGAITITNQSCTTQVSGKGIFSAIFPPGSCRPYSEGGGSNNYNTSNGLNFQTTITGSAMGIEAVEVVGATLDASGNCASDWTYVVGKTSPGCMRFRSCMIYDPGQTKYRPDTSPPNDTWVWPNVPLWAYDNQTPDPFVAPLLQDNVFVKTAGGAGVIACHNAGQTPNQTGGGMTSYTASDVNALNGTTGAGGLWQTRGNVTYSSLGDAYYNSSGQYTGRRYVGRQRGASSRGY